MSTLHFYSPFFFPEEISTGRYNHFLVDALWKRGHNVTVVCSYPFYPEWIVSTAIPESRMPVRLLRGGMKVRYPRSNVLRRMILELWFALHCLHSGRKLNRCPADVIVDIYPPNLFALFRRGTPKRKTRIVAIVHDLQGIMMEAQASVARRLLGASIRSMERAALRRADRLVFLSQGMLNQAISMYGVDAGKCSVSYPFSTISKHAPVRVPAALAGSGKTLIYAGALGEKQAPDQLVELMDAFARKWPDFQVHIFSNGPHFDRLKGAGARTGSPVRFNSLVAGDELTGLLSRSTIQIIPQKSGLSDGAFPSKLPNLFESNTAIFAITDEGSELSMMLRAYRKGAVSDTWDLDANLEALATLADKLASLENAGASKESQDAPVEPWGDNFRVDELCRIIESALVDASTKPPRQVPV